MTDRERHYNAYWRDPEKHRKKQRDWRSKMSAKRRQKMLQGMSDYARLWRYGMTAIDFKALLRKQRGLCAICSVKLITRRTGRGIKFNYACVDHDHVSEIVRGILCNKCNRAVGLLADSLKIAKRVVKYLSRRKRS